MFLVRAVEKGLGDSSDHDLRPKFDLLIHTVELAHSIGSLMRLRRQGAKRAVTDSFGANIEVHKVTNDIFTLRYSCFLGEGL